MANNSQRGTSDRIQAKVEKIKHFTREAAKITVSQQMSTHDGAEVQSMRGAFQEREQQLQQQIEREREEAQQQIQEVKKEAEVIRLYIITLANSLTAGCLGLGCFAVLVG